MFSKIRRPTFTGLRLWGKTEFDDRAREFRIGITRQVILIREARCHFGLFNLVHYILSTVLEP